MRSIATTSIHSIPAVDASPSGPKNGCLPVPGLTPFAGRLRPVGAVGFGIVDVASAHPERRWVLFRAKQWLLGCTRAHALRWQITPRWGCRDRCCGDLHYVIDPFSIGSRCVPFRAEKRLLGCTRAHALRWQITPRWGCRDRCCGDLHYVIDPFSIGSRCVPFRAEQWLLRCTRAHAFRWQIRPRWGCWIVVSLGLRSLMAGLDIA